MVEEASTLDGQGIRLEVVLPIKTNFRYGYPVHNQSGDWIVLCRFGTDKGWVTKPFMRHEFYPLIGITKWLLTAPSKRTWSVLVFNSRESSGYERRRAIANERFASRTEAIKRCATLVERLQNDDVVAPASYGQIFLRAEDADLVEPGVTPPGWKIDPDNSKALTYWDGKRWSGEPIDPTARRTGPTDE